LGHRPGLLDEKAKADSIEEVRQRSLEGNSWGGKGVIRKEFEKTVEGYWRATHFRREDKNYATRRFTPGASTMAELVSDYLPEKMKQADKQNVGRLKARLGVCRESCGSALVRDGGRASRQPYRRRSAHLRGPPSRLRAERCLRFAQRPPPAPRS
jgi:hypothetical protein